MQLYCVLVIAHKQLPLHVIMVLYIAQFAVKCTCDARDGKSEIV